MREVGIVQEIDQAKCLARVIFPDKDNMVSGWLSVVQRNTYGHKSKEMPKKGEQVSCLMDENLEEGEILGGIYSDEDPPPVSEAKGFYIEFEDGSIIEYDEESKKLVAVLVGEAEVTATKITATAPEIVVNGDVRVYGKVYAQEYLEL